MERLVFISSHGQGIMRRNRLTPLSDQLHVGTPFVGSIVVYEHNPP